MLMFVSIYHSLPSLLFLKSKKEQKKNNNYYHFASPLINSPNVFLAIDTVYGLSTSLSSICTAIVVIVVSILPLSYLSSHLHRSQSSSSP